MPRLSHPEKAVKELHEELLKYNGALTRVIEESGKARSWVYSVLHGIYDDPVVVQAMKDVLSDMRLLERRKQARKKYRGLNITQQKIIFRIKLKIENAMLHFLLGDYCKAEEKEAGFEDPDGDISELWIRMAEAAMYEYKATVVRRDVIQNEKS